MKPLDLNAGIGCLLSGAIILWWVLRENRKVRSCESRSKWSPGFLLNLLFTAMALIVFGIVMLVL
jgi:hypothetical protein